MTFDPHLTGLLISRPRPLVLDHLGPTIEVLTDGATPSGPGLARGTIDTQGFVPLHSHSDPETFYVLEGTLEALTFPFPDTPVWRTVHEGQVFHAPPHARHALRNVSDDTATALIISTADMARFLEQTGRPLEGVDAVRTPPTPADIDHMLRVAADHGHWIASPRENALVGIELPGVDGS